MKIVKLYIMVSVQNDNEDIGSIIAKVTTAIENGADGVQPSMVGGRQITKKSEWEAFEVQMQDNGKEPS